MIIVNNSIFLDSAMEFARFRLTSRDLLSCQLAIIFFLLSQDAEYWKMYSAVVDEKKVRLWDALIAGFDKYNETLTERAKLIQSTDSLRQQVMYPCICFFLF